MAGVGCLSFEEVAKSFGGTQALRGVSFDVARGEIVACFSGQKPTLTVPNTVRPGAMAA